MMHGMDAASVIYCLCEHKNSKQHSALVQALDHASQHLALLLQLQRLASQLAASAAAGDGGAATVSPQQLEVTQAAVDAVLRSGAFGSPASPLQLAPLQSLAWALDAARHDPAEVRRPIQILL